MIPVLFAFDFAASPRRVRASCVKSFDHTSSRPLKRLCNLCTPLSCRIFLDLAFNRVESPNNDNKSSTFDSLIETSQQLQPEIDLPCISLILFP